MDQDANRTALRESRRLQRLGGESDVCVICAQPACKTVSLRFAMKHGISRQLVEHHHIVGRDRDAELLVSLCLTHHWLATTGLLREGIGMRREHAATRRIAKCLKAVAVLLEMLAPALRQWANLLLKETK